MWNTKYTLIITITTALVFFGIGFATTVFFPNIARLSLDDDEPDNTFQAGWNAAKERLEQVGYIIPRGERMVTELRGQVEGITDKNITLKINPTHPLDEVNLDIRVVGISSDTKIFKLVPKDRVQLEKEMIDHTQRTEEYIKKTKEEVDTTEMIVFLPEDLPNLPNPYIKVEASWTDVEVGQLLNIVTDEDVQNLKSFNASIVEIFPVSLNKFLPTED